MKIGNSVDVLITFSENHGSQSFIRLMGKLTSDYGNANFHIFVKGLGKISCDEIGADIYLCDEYPGPAVLEKIIDNDFIYIDGSDNVQLDFLSSMIEIKNKYNFPYMYTHTENEVVRGLFNREFISEFDYNIEKMISNLSSKKIFGGYMDYQLWKNPYDYK